MMRYLTVHDVIWMNTAVTGSPQRYDFNRLENAVYHQYSYGDSHDVLAQAGRMFHRLLKDQPFEQGNDLTALVAAAVLLRFNGYALRIAPDEVPSILSQLAQGQLDATELLRQRAEPVEPATGSLRSVAAEVCHALHLPMKAALVEAH